MDGTTTTASGGAGGENWAAEPSAGDQTPMLSTAVGDQCANCGARLAGDQHYCVECGERRGKPRYALPATAVPTDASRPSPVRRRPRLTMSSSSTLIAGVATLLLAMGVGLLIGLSVNKAPASSASKVVVVPSGGTPSAASSGTSPATAATRGTGASAANAALPTPKASTSKKVLSVKTNPKLRTVPKQLKSAVVKQGQSCASGGKFTGNFFGPSGNRTGCTH